MCWLLLLLLQHSRRQLLVKVRCGAHALLLHALLWRRCHHRRVSFLFLRRHHRRCCCLPLSSVIGPLSETQALSPQSVRFRDARGCNFDRRTARALQLRWARSRSSVQEEELRAYRLVLSVGEDIRCWTCSLLIGMEEEGRAVLVRRVATVDRTARHGADWHARRRWSGLSVRRGGVTHLVCGVSLEDPSKTQLRIFLFEIIFNWI